VLSYPLCQILFGSQQTILDRISRPKQMQGVVLVTCIGLPSIHGNLGSLDGALNCLLQSLNVLFVARNHHTHAEWLAHKGRLKLAHMHHQVHGVQHQCCGSQHLRRRMDSVMATSND